jgi:hypothetical protein
MCTTVLFSGGAKIKTRPRESSAAGEVARYCLRGIGEAGSPQRPSWRSKPAVFCACSLTCAMAQKCRVSALCGCYWNSRMTLGV